MPDPSDSKIIRIDPAEDRAHLEAENAAQKLYATFSRPLPTLPQAELHRLCEVALGDTGQSRSVRYLLFLLPGDPSPDGCAGQGLLEMRAIDTDLCSAYLKVLEWWRGPTASDEPLYEILRKIESHHRE